MAWNSLEEAITRGKGRERSFKCPSHNDSHASASVNVIKGKWVCYTCSAHGTTSDITESEDYVFAQQILGILDESMTRIYPEAWLDLFHTPGEPCEYWFSRFSAAAIDHFRLGYDHHRAVPSPCYPMHNPSGQLLGVVYRQIDLMPKYLYPRGVTKSSLLFNYTYARRTAVVLVEGALDAVACWEAGFHAYALYGSQLSHEQVMLLKKAGVTRVILALDNDVAGRRATAGWWDDDGRYVPGVAFRLAAVGIEVLTVDWAGLDYKDIAEVPTSLRTSLLSPLDP